ncbi:SMC-Scp complex subunit ScpB, partial [Methylocystis hirsuta]|uniref:SMC-Scp complex subunit ScpB n=1 Tax=Methylocystis hirsuta TaxID=369798 RepID=UPI001FE1FD2B
MTAIAYLQPATRAELSRLGAKSSRDVIGRLKGLDLIAAGPRAPTPGAPYAYVTTRKFLEVFGLRRCAISPTSNGSKTRDFWRGR